MKRDGATASNTTPDRHMGIVLLSLLHVRSFLLVYTVDYTCFIVLPIYLCIYIYIWGCPKVRDNLRYSATATVHCWLTNIPCSRSRSNSTRFFNKKWVTPSMSIKSHSNAKTIVDGFKNDLRHPCASQTWRFSRPRGLALANTFTTIILSSSIQARPKHGSSAGWGGLAVANAFRSRLLSSSSSPCLTCAIYVVWNCLGAGPIFGAYFFLRMKGDAPSMWHIVARSVEGCREIWGTCAIYVGIPSLIVANEWDLRHLCPRKTAWCWGKKMGANQRRRLQKIGPFLGHTWCELPVWKWSCAIYPLYFAFDIEGASQEFEPCTFRLEYIDIHVIIYIYL